MAAGRTWSAPTSDSDCCLPFHIRSAKPSATCQEAGRPGRKEAELIVGSSELERDSADVLTLWPRAGSGLQLSSSHREEELRKKLVRDLEPFLIAQGKEGLLGAVLGGFDGRRGMVYHLAVRPIYRRQGIGQALMQELERRMRAKGCHKSYLLVTPGSREAQAFYRALGWDSRDLRVMGNSMA